MSRREPELVVRIGVPYAPTGLDPHVNSSELAYKLFAGVFDPLVWRTPDGRYAAGLAERWEVLDEGRTYRFRLRPGVSFHDGTALDAEAVAASFHRIADPATRSQTAKDMLGPFREALVLGTLECEVRLADPYASFLDAVSQAWLAPASPRAIAALGAGHARRPVGAGPFRVASWDPGDDLVLEANPGYAWAPKHLLRQGAAASARIAFTFINDAAARLPALRRGDIDAFFELPPEDVAEASADADHVVHRVPVPGAPVSLMLNTAREPTNDRDVRRAIAHALDVPELVSRVFAGVHQPAVAPLTASVWGYEPRSASRYPHDPARAKALLGGRQLRLVFCALTHAGYPAIGNEVARQLRDVGIDVEVRVLGIADWLRAGNEGRHHLIPVGKFTTEPDILETLYHSRHNGAGYAWTWSSDPELDDMLATAVRTLDQERRRALFSAIQIRIVDEALVIPIHENTNLTVARRELEGLKFDLRGYPILYATRRGAGAAIAR